MNAVDYLFEDSKGLSKDLILGPQEQVSYLRIYESVLKMAAFIREEDKRLPPNIEIVMSKPRQFDEDE